MSSVASLLQGSPAGLWNPVSTGVATIANGQTQSADIADTKVTASSVILCGPDGANATAASSFSCASISAGASFKVGCNVDPGADVSVRYWVMKY